MNLLADRKMALRRNVRVFQVVRLSVALVLVDRMLVFRQLALAALESVVVGRVKFPCWCK